MWQMSGRQTGQWADVSATVIKSASYTANGNKFLFLWTSTERFLVFITRKSDSQKCEIKLSF